MAIINRNDNNNSCLPLPSGQDCPTISSSTKPSTYQTHLSKIYKKDVVVDHVEDLTKAQIDDIHSFSHVQWCNYSIIEGQEIGFWGSKYLNLGS